MTTEFDNKLNVLVNHAWDQEIGSPQIDAWIKNFNGSFTASDEEERYCLFMLSRFMYFGKRLVREMLKSLFRDHFQNPLRQRTRRNNGNTRDSRLIDQLYAQELATTRFISIGNPSESGAHLLYYFRQVNHLPKDLFHDISSAFNSVSDRSGGILSIPRESTVTRYIFFDDLVGSGDQASSYLAKELKKIREGTKNLDIRFMSLFAATEGLKRLNTPMLFDGNATCLFELDGTFKAFEADSRYFSSPPAWFDLQTARGIAHHYGEKLYGAPLGYRDGQLLLGFSHNTPDNTLPIFWKEDGKHSWSPIFIRFDKVY
jgi:hypothetical protein